MKQLFYPAILITAAIGVVSYAFGQNNSGKTKQLTMTDTMVNNQAQVIRHIYDQALNKRKMELLKEYISDDFVGVRGLKGAKGFEEPVKTLVDAFPDIQWNIENIIAEGAKVVVKWRWYGTDRAKFQSFLPTNTQITNEGVGIFEFNDGKIITADIQTDRLGFLQQLEVIPADVNQLSSKNYLGKTTLIDKFFIPKKSIAEFVEQMNRAEAFVKSQPGLIESHQYDHHDEQGNLTVVTVAVWANVESLEAARNAVQSEFKRTGFNSTEFYQRLNIKFERGIFNAVK